MTDTDVVTRTLVGTITVLDTIDNSKVAQVVTLEGEVKKLEDALNAIIREAAHCAEFPAKIIDIAVSALNKDK